jgi:complement component 1 Q subcomponent-binding protein
LTVRSFSSSSSSNATDLVSILRREHDEEVENNTIDMPKELQKLQSELEQAGWKIASQGATTKLIRSSADGVKIQIGFHCQDTVQEESSMIYEEDGAEVEEEEVAGGLRFTTTLTKAGKTMVFTCIAEDAQATIESVAMTTQTVDEVMKTGAVDDMQYQGPEFNELAEDLQESFHVYLQEDAGVNESVASFITMYADYREQVEYVEFLSDAQKLLS